MEENRNYTIFDPLREELLKYGESIGAERYERKKDPHTVLRIFTNKNINVVEISPVRKMGIIIYVKDEFLTNELRKNITVSKNYPEWTEFVVKSIDDMDIAKKLIENAILKTKDRYNRNNFSINNLQIINNKNEIVKNNTTGNTPVSLNTNGITKPGKKKTLYGQPMDFRGLRHEPVNEQGVVFLFGKINEELGISVEAVKTGFPDCEAKRLVDKNKNLWEPVSIEFEYCSKNFLDHGHDPDGCDVIVCWSHNWPDCPLEVIELKSIIGKL